ncbi:permease [Roseovarius pelagicus]|uniref:Permease n=1 Tax=Roseovarius pelagicus TaxID=2980108 RepID=A0ABY6DIX9_9RHOB|nr:permease [Roseovarius pelagicus]UXX84913.1 permease [Roseovarius pelagicus]
MSDQTDPKSRFAAKSLLIGGTLFILMLSILLWPAQMTEMAAFVFWGLVAVAPLVIPGIVLSAWIMASGADAHIARAFEGRTIQTVIVASAIGAITPVCGVTVLPLMAGLLAAGIPLAPVMAFWLSSPVTDPAMLATTVATLGLGFAVGKTVAAFGLGLWGGAITALFARRGWAVSALRQNRFVGSLAQRQCCAPASYQAAIWRSAARRAHFWQICRATTRLILICLIPAFAAEYALNAALHPAALTAYVGADVWWAIPFATLVGAPAYLDGYAALPLTRGLLDHGMSPGAAMAFLVSGGVVSIWGAMAIFPVLRLPPFLLYLALAVSGSLAAGYVFDWVMG